MSHTLIYIDELQAALADVEVCPQCKGGLGIFVEAGDWEIVELHAITCDFRPGGPRKP